MKKNIVISGTGISGLTAALLLAKQQKGYSIYLIDKNAEIGGLLRSFDYGEHGKFDYGMHNVLETGLKELDDFVYGLLPKEEWQYLKGSKRDLAGIYYNGKIQFETPYIDLRNYSKEKYDQYLASFFDHLNNFTNIDQEIDVSAYDFIVSRFGRLIAEEVVLPAIEKIHKKNAKDIAYMGTLLTPLSRIALFKEELISQLYASEIIRNRVAFVDQRNLPLDLSSGRSAYYPIKYGIYRLINGYIEALEKYDVKFLMQTEITDVIYEGDAITAVKLKNEKDFEIADIDRLFWTSNIPSLGKIFKYNFTPGSSDKPLKTIIVNILVDKPVSKMRDLYYFYCYEKGFHTFRLTYFQNYCDGAVRNGHYPLAMELLIDEEELKALDPVQLAISELNKFQILTLNTKVVFAKAEVLDSGFPMPTTRNIKLLKEIRNYVKGKKLKNLVTLGILAEDNLFFQTDVLIDTFKKIKDEKNV